VLEALGLRVSGSWRRPRRGLTFNLVAPAASCGVFSGKQREKLMAVGMFRSEEGWVQVDYGTGNIPILRSKYEENRYKPDYDKLPSEAEYQAAQKKKDDDAKGA
jgi:hypothetical protein